MDDLKVVLRPLTKLQLFRKVKIIVLSLMDKNVISTERASEIFSSVKEINVALLKPQKWFLLNPRRILTTWLM